MYNFNFFIYKFYFLDLLVKVYIKMGDKKLKKCSIVVKKYDVFLVWNEVFSFVILYWILYKVVVFL